MKRRVIVATVVALICLVLATTFVVNARVSFQEYSGQKYESLVFQFSSGFGFATVNDGEESTEINRALLEAVSQATEQDLPLVFYLDALGEMGWQMKSSLADGSMVYFFFERPQ